jgi:hypothetical protein
MMHVLPNGFVRIRYYGFLANTHRQEQLRKIRKLLDAPQPTMAVEQSDDDPHNPLEPFQDQPCPHCHEGLMRVVNLGPRPRLSEILQLPLMALT